MHRFAGDDRVPRAAIILERVRPLTMKIAAARDAGWQKWPSVNLRDIAADSAAMAAVMSALDVLTAPSAPADRSGHGGESDVP